VESGVWPPDRPKEGFCRAIQQLIAGRRTGLRNGDLSDPPRCVRPDPRGRGIVWLIIPALGKTFP
jgi:hypothetical protein